MNLKKVSYKALYNKHDSCLTKALELDYERAKKFELHFDEPP